MSSVDSGLRINPPPWWLGRAEEERARRAEPKPERCAQCGADLAAGGVHAYLEAPGAACCSLECAS